MRLSNGRVLLWLLVYTHVTIEIRPTLTDTM
jgi:hypothetical protein